MQKKLPSAPSPVANVESQNTNYHHSFTFSTFTLLWNFSHFYHLNWHSFVIKIQYVFFWCMKNFSFMVDSMSFFCVELFIRFSRKWTLGDLKSPSQIVDRLLGHHKQLAFPSFINKIFSFPRANFFLFGFLSRFCEWGGNFF